MLTRYSKLSQSTFNRHPFRLLAVFCLLIIFQWPISGNAQTTNLIPPVGSDSFGASVTILTNGNFVVTDPLWDGSGQTDVGAVYLYDGATLALISMLRGSKTNDLVGKGGIVPLDSGNFVVFSPDWNVTTGNGIKAGAVTWINGRIGLSDTISASNSLIGTSSGDMIGITYPNKPLITILSNGNFVISSPIWKVPGSSRYQAVTWGSNKSGIHGTIDAANSLIGLTNQPYRLLNVVPLTNGNYVVRGEYDDSTHYRLGSVTWGNGSTGTSGIVDSTNSLVGRYSGDNVGADFYSNTDRIIPLANGNYVIGSPNSSSNLGSLAGAATWADGAKPISGHITPSNSLVGSSSSNMVGSQIIPLPNGNYVLGTPGWDNNSRYRGAATWVNGTTGMTGYINSSNSLIGASPLDQVGSGITLLANGNFIVQSPNWTNGKGAVTLGDGKTGISGIVSGSNSLVGVSSADSVGGGGVFSLSNGNYVVASPRWDNGSIGDAGAVTWGNGSTGISGTIAVSNSLVGTSIDDAVGEAGIVPLSNGNYVVGSPQWNNGTLVDAGAVTWGHGTIGGSGIISISNSLVGGSDSDMIGSGDIRALNNGNYVIGSPNWQNTVGKVGAATWGDGRTGIVGLVSQTNSLTGSSHNDTAANNIIPLANGNFLVESSTWKDAYGRVIGALTWGNGTKALNGVIDTLNSLVYIPAAIPPWYVYAAKHRIVPLINGDYIVKDIGFNSFNGLSGYVTYGSGNGGTIGAPRACNSIFGLAVDGGRFIVAEFNPQHDYMVTGLPSENRVTIFHPSGTALALHNDSATHSLSANAISAIPFVNLSSCRLIASILPTDSNRFVGEVTSVAFIENNTPSFIGIPYVRRHFDISPETASDESTSRITLYFNQSEFTDFNANNGTSPDLPSSPSDGAGKASIRIIQEYGTSPTGGLGSYSSAKPAGFKVINPVDSNIIWNGRFNRWEVAVDVQGFGGFFAYSDAGTTAINSIKPGNPAVVVTPIPATSELSVNVDDDKLVGEQASITDIQGKLVVRFLLNHYTKLNISNWPAGVYCLRLPDASIIKITKQ